MSRGVRAGVCVGAVGALRGAFEACVACPAVCAFVCALRSCRVFVPCVCPVGLRFGPHCTQELVVQLQ